MMPQTDVVQQRTPAMAGGSDSAVISALVPPAPTRFSLKCICLRAIQLFHHTFNRKKEAISCLEQCSVLLKAVWGKELVSRTGENIN